MNIQEALSWAKNELNTNTVEGAESSALFLLEYVLDKNRTYIFANKDRVLSDVEQKKFKSYISRRAKHEPVWYITGKMEFLGLEFMVNRDVLIPRPETELLIEKIAEHVREGFAPERILDVGTGSGAIIISLANMLKENSKYFASDISREALAVAKTNAKHLDFKNITFRHGDLFEPWKGQKYDLIVANLPYVPQEDMKTLAPDLTDYEPHLALFAGEAGLATINRFIEELPNYLKLGGKVFLEIGYAQGSKIVEQVSKALPEAKVEVLGDYAGIDRIVIIET